MKRLCLLPIVFGAALGCEASVRSPAYVQPAAAVHDSRWVELANRYSAETPSQQILLRDRGAFRAIRVEGARGMPVITKVTIDYADGIPPQVVPINEQLSPGESRTIDLNGGRRNVKRVIVYTEPNYGGAYSVYGA